MGSGWSKQGGFELFLMDGSKGDRLWQIVKEAGRPFDIGPGSPNPSERAESGLLNWGVDTDERTNPLEVRLEKFVDLDVDDEVIGVQALRQIKAEGVKRHQLGVELDGDQEHGNQGIWLEIEQAGVVIGHMTQKAWSYRLEKMIGFALVSVQAKAGDDVQVRDKGRLIRARLTSLPFL